MKTPTAASLAASLVVALAVLATSLAAAGETGQQASDPVVVCYVGTWAIYRPGQGKFEPEQIDSRLCTHLVYAFASLSNDGEVRILDPWLDLPSGLNGYARFQALKKNNPRAKFLLGFGGWNVASEPWSEVANNATLRSRFAVNAAEFIEQYGFDGLDCDWEYPGLRGGRSTDKSAFIKLLKALYKELYPRKLLLTAAVSVGLDKIEASYDVPEIMKYLDLVNLMAYDLHGSWDTKTGMNAALSAGPGEDNAVDKNLNVEAAVQLWLDRGAVRGKVTLGMPLYGRSFTLSDENDNSVGAPASGPGTAGQFTREPGTLGYNEICLLQDAGQFPERWDEVRQVPYASQGNQWVSYDNERSLALKTALAQRLGLAGVMLWSLETDDFRNDCKTSGGAFPLMRAVNRALARSSSTSAPDSTPSTGAPSTPGSTPSTGAPSTPSTGGPSAPGSTPSTGAPSTGAPSAPGSTPSTGAPSAPGSTPSTGAPSATGSTPSTGAPTPPKGSSTTRTSTTTRSTTKTPRSTPTTTTPTTTPAGPTCRSSGRFERDPEDCAAFYYCFNADQPLREYPYRCSAGLYFDEEQQTCNYKDQVACEQPQQLDQHNQGFFARIGSFFTRGWRNFTALF